MPEQFRRDAGMLVKAVQEFRAWLGRLVQGPLWLRTLVYTGLFAVILPILELALSPVFGRKPYSLPEHAWKSVSMGIWFALAMLPLCRWMGYPPKKPSSADSCR